MSTKAFDLGGKVAFVTGGNGGIGKGIAIGLAEAGAAVAIAARDGAKSAVTVEEIIGLGGRAATVPCDVTDRDSVTAAIESAVETLGRLDIVVNNAGIGAPAPEPQDLQPDGWDKIVATNLTGVYNVCVLAYPHLRDGGGGKIINISSMMGIFGGKAVAAYAASKGGVDQYTKSLAIAWARDNVQVNAIQPGWIVTDLTQVSRSTPEKFENIIDRTPAGRYGEPADLAGAAVFLSSSASDFVTGVLLPVDGGYACQGTSRTIDI